jgi:hypothetical protein
MTEGLKKSRGNVYSPLLLGQCTQVLAHKMKQNTDWVTIGKSFDPTVYSLGKNFRIPTFRPSNFLNAAPPKTNRGYLPWSLSHLSHLFCFLFARKTFPTSLQRNARSLKVDTVYSLASSAVIIASSLSRPAIRFTSLPRLLEN